MLAHCRARNTWQGFCDRFGPIFEDFKNTDVSRYAFAAMLAHRLLVGCFVGAMGAQQDEHAAYVQTDEDAAYVQTSCLIFASSCYLGFIAYFRPFLVGMANLFEGLVVCTQIACLSCNYVFLSGDAEAVATAANVVFIVMGLSVLFILLRMMAVMVPVRMMLVVKKLLTKSRQVRGIARRRHHHGPSPPIAVSLR